MTRKLFLMSTMLKLIYYPVFDSSLLGQHYDATAVQLC